jgi:UDP-N-acetylmuramate--alanine ligase
VIPLADRAELARTVADLARAGDFIVCLGAGNITQWAHALPVEIAALRRGRAGAAA